MFYQKIFAHFLRTLRHVRKTAPRGATCHTYCHKNQAKNE
jgi:hypothetical protein